MMNEELKHTIVSVMDSELQRQADSGAKRIDLEAMAGAVAAVLETEPHPHGELEEGKRPDELNSNNDG